MSILNNRLVIYIYNPIDKNIEELVFTEINNLFRYDSWSYKSDTMTLNEFNNTYYNSSKLNFTWKIGNELKPYWFLQWYFSDKSKYEINKGKIYKLSNLKKDTKKFAIFSQYTFDEIKTDLLECFENVEIGNFENNYSEKYLQNYTNFTKIQM